MMYRKQRQLWLLFFLGLFLMGSVTYAQSGRSVPRPSGEPANKRNVPSPTPTPAPPELQETEAVVLAGADEDELVKVETQLVTVPIVVRDRNDRYVADLRQEEFTLSEDGTPQEIAFFSTTTAPFHVVLLLDTSSSTQDKLRQIQDAATSFTGQLQPADRVKVISFDDQVYTLCDFTNDRAELNRAIRRTRPGQGTQLYDAMNRAIASLQRVQGRKAIVIFTDGVDTTSNNSSYDKNIRALEEAGIILYPIRFDTRADVEALIRQQRSNGGLVDLGTILGLPSGRGGTPPTVPGGSPAPMPRRTPNPSGGGGITLPGGINIPIGTNRRNDPNDPRYPRDPNDPNGGNYPRDPNDPNSSRYPNPNDPTNTRPDSGGLSSSERAELDRLYRTGDEYLRDLAQTTGGSLYRADYLGQLPAAFSQIAAELRTQYALGYYPSNKIRDGKFRKIKVKATRNNVAVRARPGYRLPR